MHRKNIDNIEKKGTFIALTSINNVTANYREK